jgi:hypothetical protein
MTISSLSRRKAFVLGSGWVAISIIGAIGLVATNQHVGTPQFADLEAIHGVLEAPIHPLRCKGRGIPTASIVIRKAGDSLWTGSVRGYSLLCQDGNSHGLVNLSAGEPLVAWVSQQEASRDTEGRIWQLWRGNEVVLSYDQIGEENNAQNRRDLVIISTVLIIGFLLMLVGWSNYRRLRSVPTSES